MLKARRWYAICLFLLVALFVLTPSVHGQDYKGFSLLNPDECALLDKKVVLQLPAEWHRYGDFVKICGLAQNKGQPAKVSIISVWADDYYETQSPTPMWENFPLPLIVNSTFHPVGRLPEVYPSNPPHWLKVYYGKWQSDIPAEIRVDVENPAVTGDYYYDPLIWNKDKDGYKMKSEERTYGGRRK